MAGGFLLKSSLDLSSWTVLVGNGRHDYPTLG